MTLTNKELKQKLDDLKKELEHYEKSVIPAMKKHFDSKPKFIVFLSASDAEDRAQVVHAVANTFSTSWKNAENLLKKSIKLMKGNPKWLKADLVTSIEHYKLQDFLQYVNKIKRNYFREGIALDSMFNTAFLEQEVNANVFLHGLKERKPHLALNNINFYRKKYQNERFDFKEEHIKDIYTFSTKAFFADAEGLYELENGKLSNGCRKIDKIDKPFIKEIINQSSNFLAGEVLESGQFRYGYFPAFDREINTYNILRHSSTTYSMVEAYEITKHPELKKAIERALQFLIEDAIKFLDVDEKKRAFVIEKSLGNEIKLGANAAAILAFAKYTKVMGDEQYIPLMEQLAAGVEYFQREDGSFVHVLNYPDLSLKDEYRTIYYDGEAAFGLMRLYDITHDDYWLNIVEKAFEYFIKADHWKHGDHWLSYCSNELFTYRPERKYAEFNLKNANRMLDFSLTRETAFPTLLELMMASHNMIVQMKERQLHLDLLDHFDEEKLERVIEHRVRHQLNSYFWPEMAMYFKTPKNILHSFYIRHHSYRVRIDDVEHNISGYCNYYHNVLTKPKVRSLSSEDKVRNLSLDKKLPFYEPKKKLVGMIREEEYPTKEALVAAIASQLYNKDFIYFTPQGILDKGKIQGYLFVSPNSWKEVETVMPASIDNLTGLSVSTSAHLLDENPMVTSYQLTNKLFQTSRLKPHTMPFHHVKNEEEVMQYVKIYPAITIHRDDRVIQSIFNYEGTYLVTAKQGLLQVEKEKLKDYLLDIDNNTYVQQYIQMTTELGIPYKLKYLIQQKEDGWKTTHSYAQLNHNVGFQINTTDESSIIKVESLLIQQYQDQAKQIQQSIQELLTILTRELDNDKTISLPVLEVIISVDLNKEVWIEVLRRPSRKFREELEVQMFKAGK